MENLGRREFIKGIWVSTLLPFIPQNAFGTVRKGIHVTLPEIKFQTTYLQGKRKGGRILLIGGIHGNEPGAYKCAEILRQVKVERGELFIAPRSNFISILANVRGYNGDMNRKFAKLSKKDPDYPYVLKLKRLIKEIKPDVVLSLHDGFGFHILNKRFWGQCIVIDEERYKNFELGKIARTVSRLVNSKIRNKRWLIPVFNTHTFSKNTKHPEQRRSLTYYCLSKCNTQAYCLEASKQLPNLETKVKTHLLMLKEFFRIFNLEIKPDFNFLIENCERILNERKTYTANLKINGRKIIISSNKTIKVPSKSEVEFLSFHGSDGTNVIPVGVNLNWRKFTIRDSLSLKIKDDYLDIFKVKLIPI
ncbi:M14/M99 family metallopeptidase [Desulfurobacterium thermolithotrophum]|uniref:M14/M99 family metallopeptidase n=1 Tax=Desulfurobacterium thermolithotrophum TaxID=64160 RepID=UPI0013CFBD7B|nr:M14/M99 family metallopeptidase [Desulfurobacterium thermolithotrophum]